MNIPDELIDAARNNNLIVFVGAGLSYNLENKAGVKIEGWAKLLKRILYFLETKKVLRESDIIELLKIEDPYEILDYIEELEETKKLPKKKIVRFVKNFCTLSEKNDFELQKKLYDLSNVIITTNYDNAFELANPELKQNILTYGGMTKLRKTIDINKDSILLKIHGCCNKRKGMLILLAEEYDMMYLPGIKIIQNMSNGNFFRNFQFNKKIDAALNMIESLMLIIKNKNVLFIGYGMNELLVNYLIDTVTRYNKQNHFIITKYQLTDIPLKKEISEFLIPVQISDYKEIDDIVNILITKKNTTANN